MNYFLEDEAFRIKDNTHNTFWIRHGFGQAVFKQMAMEPISCSGVTLGSIIAFIEYLEKMLGYLVSLPNVGGLDQSIHNYLIFTNQLKGLFLVADDEGPVTTLTTFKPISKIKFNKQEQLLNNHAEVMPIVHQYDRHMKLLWRFNKPAFFEKATNLTKRRILLLLGRKFND